MAPKLSKFPKHNKENIKKPLVSFPKPVKNTNKINNKTRQSS